MNISFCDLRELDRPILETTRVCCTRPGNPDVFLRNAPYGAGVVYLLIF